MIDLSGAILLLLGGLYVVVASRKPTRLSLALHLSILLAFLLMAGIEWSLPAHPAVGVTAWAVSLFVFAAAVVRLLRRSQRRLLPDEGGRR